MSPGSKRILMGSNLSRSSGRRPLTAPLFLLLPIHVCISLPCLRRPKLPTSKKTLFFGFWVFWRASWKVSLMMTFRWDRQVQDWCRVPDSNRDAVGVGNPKLQRESVKCREPNTRREPETDEVTPSLTQLLSDSDTNRRWCREPDTESHQKILLGTFRRPREPDICLMLSNCFLIRIPHSHCAPNKPTCTAASVFLSYPPPPCRWPGPC